MAFWDTGELQTVGPLLGTAHPTGFPTYVILGWLASVVLQPFGEPAFRMNLLSAICLAVAAGLTVDLVRALTRSTALGFVAGLGLALTPIAWSIGTHADAHALYLVLVVVLLRLLLAWETRVRWEDDATPGVRSHGREAGDLGDRYLVAAAAVFGLARWHPLADPAGSARGRPLRLRGRPRRSDSAAASSWPASPRSSSPPPPSTWSCRSAPDPSGRPWSTDGPRPGTGSGTSPSASSSRAAWSIRSATCRARLAT